MMCFDKEKLNILLKKVGINANDKALSRFEMYYEFLVTENKKMNLTAITDPEEVMIKHFVDSAAPFNYINIKGSLIDIGTGAGFPGVPLKILNPNLKLTLLDSLDKRINFLIRLCKKLDLDNVETIHGRAEELAHNEIYREKFDFATSRAVAKLAVLNEYALPLLKVGGSFLSYKSTLIDDELSCSENSLNILGGKLKQTIDISLSGGKLDRKILIIEKTQESPCKYPRRAGIPSKRPL